MTGALPQKNKQSQFIIITSRGRGRALAARGSAADGPIVFHRAAGEPPFMIRVLTVALRPRCPIDSNGLAMARESRSSGRRVKIDHLRARRATNEGAR